MPENARPLWRNTLTYIGSALVGLSVLSISMLLFLDLVTREPNPYLGMFTFMILPGFVILGGLIATTGIVIARVRAVRRNGGREVEYLPHINLNLPSHRKVLIRLLGALAVTIPFLAVMSYEGYHYTDSNSFCGGVCHDVMHPQYLAHRRSPHARVECATCHIGRGASWYVKAKLSGLRQVMAVMRGSYPRPIPSAIKELRPARETCERCHWPAKFYGDQLVTINHFAANEENSLRPIRMLIKTGGNDPTTAPPSGVHWHMALGHNIEFVAVDEALQEIPWVRTTDHETNTQRVYRNDGLISTDPPPEGELRLLDCMSCHNRATHVFRTPWNAADDVFMADPTLAELPYAKREIVKAVVARHDSKEVGLHEVATQIEDFYLINYPKIAATKRMALHRLIAAAQGIYELISFPEMNVTWRTYPNNIGHKEFPGCFRCHAGDHVDDHGRTISHECSTCHEFLTPANGGIRSSLIREGAFEHPIDLQGPHANMRCDFCHDGGMAPNPECAGCHTDQAAFLEGTSAVFESFEIEEDVMNGDVECEDCHDLSMPTSAAVIDAVCFDCHDEPEYEGLAMQWKTEVEERLSRASAAADDDERAILKALMKAGPLHNIEASRRILEKIAGNDSLVQASADGEASE